MEFNLRHIQAFLGVCEVKGITAAVERVYLSQPAITQAIAKLELNLGMPLFTRSSRGMFLTPAAEILKYRCERAFAFLHGRLGPAKHKEQKNLKPQKIASLTNTQLRAFKAIAKYRNYSVAARAVGIAQPSIYRSLHDLNALMDESLFEKTPRGIALTQAGQELLCAVNLAHSELAQALDQLDEIKNVGARGLRVGGFPLARNVILPATLSLMMEQGNHLQVKIIDGPYEELLLKLREGEIDMIIGALRDPIPADDLAQEVLFRDRLAVVCGNQHPLLKSNNLKPKNLLKFPWVVAGKGTPSRKAFELFFSKSRRELKTTLIETSSTELVRGLLQNQQTLAMISITQIAQELKNGVLSTLNIPIGDTPRKIGVLYRISWEATDTQQKFISLIREVCQNQALAIYSTIE